MERGRGCEWEVQWVKGSQHLPPVVERADQVVHGLLVDARRVLWVDLNGGCPCLSGMCPCLSGKCPCSMPVFGWNVTAFDWRVRMFGSRKVLVFD